MPSAADHTTGAAVHRTAGAVVENRRRAKDVALDQSLDAVDHPLQVAHAGNHFRVGKQPRNRRHPRAPELGWCRKSPGRCTRHRSCRTTHAGCARRWVSSMNIENSLRALISPSRAPNRPASGPVIPASNRGFWRSSAASKVEPERGRPEMKWMDAMGAPLPKLRPLALGAESRQLMPKTLRVCREIIYRASACRGFGWSV